MGERGGELVATDEPTVSAEPLPDAIVVEDSQGDGGLPASASTDESERREVLCTADYLLDQLVASKEDPRWRGLGLSGHARYKYEIQYPLVVEIADLV